MEFTAWLLIFIKPLERHLYFLRSCYLNDCGIWIRPDKKFYECFPLSSDNKRKPCIRPDISKAVHTLDTFFCKPNAILNKRTQDLERWRGACWVGEQGHVTSEGDFSSLVVPKIKLSTKGADAVLCGSLPHHRRSDSNCGCSSYKRCGLSRCNIQFITGILIVFMLILHVWRRQKKVTRSLVVTMASCSDVGRGCVMLLR